MLGAREIRVALPLRPVDGVATHELLAGVERARHGARLVMRALADGATDRAAMLASLRRLGDFDTHGDLPDPPVWLWHSDAAWNLRPDRPL